MALGRQVGQVLRASVAVAPVEERRRRVREGLAGVRPGALDGLARAAALHGIPAYVDDVVADCEAVPGPERAAVRAMRDQTRMRHLRTLTDLAHLRDVLGEAGIPWLIVKGPTLALPVHGGVDRRTYGDLDVLVPAAAFGDALDALEGAGSEVLDRDWGLIHDHMKGELHLRLPSGGALDLHWHLLNDARVRATYRIPMGEVFASPRTVDVGGVDVPTMNPAATTVHVAMHAMLSGGHRLVWLKDLDNLVAGDLGDMVSRVDTARAWGAELVLAGALRRTLGAVDGARVAPMLTACRRHRAWSMVTAAAWSVSPAEREDGTGSVGRITSRAMGPSQRASLHEFARRTRSWARGRRPGSPHAPAPPPADRGRALRAAYVSRVAASADAES